MEQNNHTNIQVTPLTVIQTEKKYLAHTQSAKNHSGAFKRGAWRTGRISVGFEKIELLMM